MHQLAFGQIGGWEVLVVAIVALLLFGKRLPEIARSAGKAVSSFKKGLNDTQDELDEAGKSDEPRKTRKSDEKSGPKSGA